MKWFLPRLTLGRNKQQLLTLPPLEVELGRRIVLLGPSGSGKTSFLNVLSGLAPKHFNAWCVDEKNQVWEGFKVPTALIPQNPFNGFFTPTVEREIVFPLENLGLKRSEQKRRLEEALAWAEIEHLRYRKPTTLSGGEAQRVHLALAVARKPTILLMDEPLAFLDKAAAQNFVGKLGQLNHETVSLVVDHDPRPWVGWAHEWWIIDEQGNLYITTQPPELSVVQSQPAVQPNLDCLFQVEDLWFRYDATRWIFKGFSLEVRRGETLALVGPSGSGKSTFFKLLTGLLKPQNGKVFFEGQKKESRGWKPLPYTQAIYLPQNPEHYFWRPTLGDEAQEDGVPPSTLEKFGLAHRIEISPFGLSTGEQRRLTLACSWSKKRPLLLLDEPSYGLDSKAFNHLIQDLQIMQHSGQTILLITHREELAHVAHRQISLVQEVRQ